jgi:hypothetical protein
MLIAAIVSRAFWLNGCVICRDEVAGCSERAYRSLKVEDAQRVLLMPNSQETCHYAAEVRALRISLPVEVVLRACFGCECPASQIAAHPIFTVV